MNFGKKSHDGEGKFRKGNIALVLCNVILILGVIGAAVIYSQINLNQKNAMKRDSFCNALESLKQVSENYLSTEKGYVDDWAAYISSQHMTAEEALAYITATNTHEDRAAHLVNLEDMSARSTVMRNGIPWVHCYEEIEKLATSGSVAFLDKMNRMINAAKNEVLVLGKYRVGETQRTVVSVGTKVTIREEDGTDRDYLLLRLIPVEYLQKTWVFPIEFSKAEISLIARDGGYMVQSPSMRSSSFLEFIRGYNFQDNYNQVYELADQLANNDSGLLEYKNSAGENCYFYYSSLGQDTEVCILGYIPVAEIQSDATDWNIVLLICGTLLLLAVIDGQHILAVNRELRRAVKSAEKANMAKTQFLSAMSHDIRTPMNAVIGMTEIARHHLDDKEYVKDCLNKVSLSGNHLLTLINDILDISKVESGKMTLNPCAFSLKDIVEELAAMIRQSAEDKDLSFLMKMNHITQNVVMGDPLRIRQILLNLLNNAVKYTEPGGHVLFEVSEEMIPEQPENVRLRFVVEDNGIGMSEEFQKTMYQSFARATDSRINKIQGSGLGLSIACQMVELMKGKITCNSTLGKGTTFVVVLEVPVAHEILKAEKLSGGTEEEQGGAFAGMRILVAEDNELNWEIIHMMLEEHGVISDRVENGQECLELLEKEDAPRFDLVLMDVQMPVMDGREATRRLRSSPNAYMRNIPVIAMTADAFAEDIYACLEAGMDGHIAKPVDMSRVLHYLRIVKSGMLVGREENK